MNVDSEMEAQLRKHCSPKNFPKVHDLIWALTGGLCCAH